MLISSTICFRERFDRLVQATLAPGARSHISAGAQSLLLPHCRNGLIADIGCGFASPLHEAAFQTIGIDINPSRALAHARRGHAVAADASALPFSDGQFVAAFSSGLLHHLDDNAARRAIGEMIRVVRRDGAVIIFDGVKPSSMWKLPLASAIRNLDFGHHMRTEGELAQLLSDFPSWTYDRVTYASTGLEGVWCVYHRAT